jgi:nicotinate-nucleotide pyrophosphorylase (carboxylating)
MPVGFGRRNTVGGPRQRTERTTSDIMAGMQHSTALSTLIRRSLEEDIGPGDVTTTACVPAGLVGAATIRAKQDLVVCGHREAVEVFNQVGADYRPAVEEGCKATPGTVVATVVGPVRALLMGERVALNFLMHLSGIATNTARVVGVARRLRVVDTRKTTPLIRAQQRRAVRAGGGSSHRFALYDGVLIKDNHIVAAGGVGVAIAAARAHAHHLLRIEVEVEDAAQARAAVEAGADVVMLDNMSNEQMAGIVAELKGRALFEASGNMTAERLPGLEDIGIDVVSIGGLIHQARWVDLSMKLDPMDVLVATEQG